VLCRWLAIRTDVKSLVANTLIVGAFIEDHSCEKFIKLAPFLEDELKKFYNGLLESERRYFTIYLYFAEKYAQRDITQDIKRIAEVEKKLILSPNTEFRFHSVVLV